MKDVVNITRELDHLVVVFEVDQANVANGLRQSHFRVKPFHLKPSSNVSVGCCNVLSFLQVSFGLQVGEYSHDKKNIIAQE